MESCCFFFRFRDPYFMAYEIDLELITAQYLEDYPRTDVSVIQKKWLISPLSGSGNVGPLPNGRTPLFFQMAVILATYVRPG